MKENICTIPVNEVFEENDGCPICRMRDLIEAKYIDYITGPAMMEPDIRIETNRAGFCERHYGMMLTSGRARLPVALTLESHMIDIREKMLAKKPDKKTLEALEKLENSCFVCEYIEPHLARSIETVCLSYKNEPEFRKLYESQPYICLHHYRMIVQNAKKPLGKEYDRFVEITRVLVRKYADSLQDDIAAFRDAFDYRNAGKPLPKEAKNAIERTMEFLTSRPFVSKAGSNAPATENQAASTENAPQ